MQKKIIIMKKATKKRRNIFIHLEKNDIAHEKSVEKWQQRRKVRHTSHETEKRLKGIQIKINKMYTRKT